MVHRDQYYTFTEILDKLSLRIFVLEYKQKLQKQKTDDENQREKDKKEHIDTLEELQNREIAQAENQVVCEQQLE